MESHWGRNEPVERQYSYTISTPPALPRDSEVVKSQRDATASINTAKRIQSNVCSFTDQAGIPPTTSTETLPPKLFEKPSTKAAFKALHRIANMWELIGVMLEIPKGRLGSLRTEYHRDNDRLLQVINIWLASIGDVTWKALIEAVEDVGELAVAEEIRKTENL